MDRYIQIDTFSRITQVSRETIVSLEKYEKMLITANKIEINITEIALNILVTETVRPKTATDDDPRTVAHKDKSNNENVVVLIPPPVDPGEAPINIKNTIIHNVEI